MPLKFIPYEPNTIEGQAVLNNITRTQRLLSYRDGDKVVQRILRGMPYYEVTPVEAVGQVSENMVIRGECVSACAYLKDKGIEVDLVYIDPPFASGADYAKKVFIRKNPQLGEQLDEAEQALEMEELRTFEEKMYGDIWDKEKYLNWMYENLVAIKGVMSESATIYVHLDFNIGHYVRVLMDEVFGEDNFINEIIWHYENKPQFSFSQHFPRDYDVIFAYCKKFGNHSFSHQNTAVAKPRKQNAIAWDPVLKKRISKRDSEGNIVYQFPTEKLLGSVWNIPMVNPAGSERLDYATQKPEALLQRIVKASTNEGMLVADFFGGSGVTAKVANDLGRRFIHSDVGINSIQTARDRLLEAKASFQILEIQDGVSLFRNPQQTMDKLAQFIPGLQRGIAGLSKFWFGAVLDPKEGTLPVYVPDLINSQEKCLDIPAVNKIINQELQNLNFDAKRVLVYFIDIDDRAALEKFIHDNNATETVVELRDLKHLLHEVVIEDIAKFEVVEVEQGFQTKVKQFVSDRLLQKIDAFNQKGNQQSLKKGKKFDPITISDDGLELIELIAVDCTNAEGAWHSTTEIKIDKLGYVIRDGVKTKQFWDGSLVSASKPMRVKVRNISGDETVVRLG